MVGAVNGIGTWALLLLLFPRSAWDQVLNSRDKASSPSLPLSLLPSSVAHLISRFSLRLLESNLAAAAAPVLQPFGSFH